jgi:hypothetical protein
MSDHKDQDPEIALVDAAAEEPEVHPDTPEEHMKQRITWLKAVLGEFLCTTLFLFIVMAAGVSFARSQEARGVAAVNPVLGAVSTGFCAVALVRFLLFFLGRFFSSLFFPSFFFCPRSFVFAALSPFLYF